MSIEANFKLRRGDFSLDVALNVPSSGVTSIMGASGCGKTTLLRLLAGLEKCESGKLSVGGELWQDENLFLPAHRRKVGYVFQEASLFDHLNVEDNIAYGFKRIPVSERRLSLERVIDVTGVGPLLKRATMKLSGGERQRVAIARALATSPKILLMDEPLAALDSAARKLLLPMLESLQNELEIPLFYVSHSPDEVARLADHLILMEAGSITAAGSMAEMFTRCDLPLAHSDEAEALVVAVVAGHDEHYKLTYLDFAGGRFSVPIKTLQPGKEVRLRVLARDVSLTLEHQKDTSILNIFPVIIDEISPSGESQLVIRVLANGVPLLSRVTRKSADLLKLDTGKKVFAQAKSVALLL